MMSGTQHANNAHGFAKWQQQHELPLTTQLLDHGLPEIELSDYHNLPSPSSSDTESPTGLLNGEGLKVKPIADLDIFFEQLYYYYSEKGLWCITVKWILEILSVIFVLCFIWFFLLVVDWHALRNVKCGVDAIESGNKPCDLAKEATNEHPFVPFTFIKGVIVGSMIILTTYGLFNFLKFIVQFKKTLTVRDFYYNNLNITDREIQTTSWPAILEKVIQLQQSQQLCVVKDLSAHDIMMRIMRKENYFIAMLNKGVLAFPFSWWVPGTGPAVHVGENGRKYHLILPKTLEWTLNWCIFQSMFDSKFYIQRESLNPSLLRRRLMFVGVGMLLISPCLVIFMLVYLFLKHAEQFYHQPSTASSRRWSNLAKWIFREFNEVEHLFRYRISNSIEDASNYLKQFPSPLVTRVARFVSFVSSGLAAVLIIIAFMDESLLEGHIFGRNLFWYTAIFGSMTAISRAAIADELQVLDHEGAMSLVVQHTHYMPKRWRGKESSDLVHSEFETLFKYTGKILVEEMVSIFLTPVLLIFVVPKRVDSILRFISDYTVNVEGVGHVCSFSTFDFKSHGNRRYGSPCDAAREKSSQGKMEKSFLSFQSTYHFWEPSDHGREYLSTLLNFKEKQLHQFSNQDYFGTRTKQATAGFRDQSNFVHLLSSQNVLYNNRGTPGNGQHLGSVSFINVEQRINRYILDWYYAFEPLDQMETVRASPSVNEAFRPMQEFRARLSKLETKIEREDKSWYLPLSDQLPSNVAATPSSTLLKNSELLNRDLDKHAMNRWWARASPIPYTRQSSFREPPGFGHQNFSRHSNDVPETPTDTQLLSGGKGKTAYIEESDNDDLPFVDSPFVDSYDKLNNLTVKTIPKGDD